MEKQTRQFKGTRKKKTEYYDHKVIHSHTTRSLCLGKILPKDWSYVRVLVLSKGQDSITCKITKLLGTENHAHSKEANQTNKQNT